MEKSTFGYVTSGTSSGNATPPLSSLLPVDGDTPEEIERKLEIYKDALMKAAIEKQQREAEKKRLEEEEKKRLEEEEKKRLEEIERERLKQIEKERLEQIEKERVEKEMKDKEEARLKQLEEERVLRKAEFDRQMALQKAENDRRIQEEQRDKQKEMKKNAVLRKKEAAAKKKEKVVAADKDYSPEVDSEDEEEGSDEDVSEKNGSQKKKAKPTMTRLEYIAAFTKHDFTGTAYPDMPTIEALGIKKDYLELIRGCGLETYVSKFEPTYPEAAAEFLATVKYHEMKSDAYIDTSGGGYIDFVINKKTYARYLKELTDLFGFPAGKPKSINIDENEMDEIWELLTGNEKFKSGTKKAVKIRSPTVAYVRKVIAETFYSRTKTGPCSANDLTILMGGIKEVLIENPVSQELIVGDTNDASLAYVLAKHLQSYRGKIAGQLKKSTAINPIAIGGPITSIMKAAGVQIDWLSEDVIKYPPRRMDVRYLHDQFLLAGPKNDTQFFYRFPFPGQPEAFIKLPNTEVTSFEDPMNIQFIPPEEFLVDAEVVNMGSKPSSSERATASSVSRKKKAPAVVKAKVVEKVVESAVLTQEQRDEMREELREEMTPLLITQLTPILTEQLTPVITEQLTPLIAQQLTPLLMARIVPVLTAQLTPVITTQVREHILEKKKKKKSKSTEFRVPSSPSEHRERPSPTISTGVHKRPSSGSSTTPGPDTRPEKTPRLHAPSPGDSSSAPLPAKKKPTIRVNMSSRS